MNRLLRTLMVVWVTACTGRIQGSGPSGSGGGSVAEPPRECRPLPSPMRALTARQYDAAILDLLGDASQPAAALPKPKSEYRFDNHADWVGVDEVLLRFYVKTAQTVADGAVGRQAMLFPCAQPPTAEEEACAQRILNTVGRRAYRRTLNLEERDTALGVFRTVRALNGARYDDALSAMLQVLLQSPQFLYVTETGTPVAGAPRPTSRLTGVETATKLALFLWGSVPDDALLDAAEQGLLETAQDVEREARRMLLSPKARRGFLHFATQWLQVEGLGEAQKSPVLFPAWTPAAQVAARLELEDFAAGHFEGGLTFKDLMLSKVSLVDATLASLYGMPAPIGGPERRTLPDERAGVLTRIAFLATQAHPEATSPTLRGKAVRTHLLCEEIAPPPPGVNVMLPNVAGPATLRTRLEAHLDASGSCAGCHRLMDPIGFGLEAFDAVGSYRTQEPNGLPIDPRGEIHTGASQVSFSDARGLSAALADSPQANRCYLGQVYRYAQGRTESSKDRCHLDQLDVRLGTAATLQDIAVAIATSTAFLTRESLP